jgi:hypothetical protein
LTIAIPCLLLVAWFNTKVDRIFRAIDECLIETMPSFARMEKLAMTTTPIGEHRPSSGDAKPAEAKTSPAREAPQAEAAVAARPR